MSVIEPPEQPDSGEPPSAAGLTDARRIATCIKLVRKELAKYREWKTA